MKNYLFLAFFILTLGKLFSQKTSNNLFVEYNLSINSFQYKGILQYAENKSTFCWYDSSITQRKILKSGNIFAGDFNLKVIDTAKKYIEVNYLAKQIFETKFLNETNIVSVVEPIQPISWDILNETKLIGKFQCIKAVGSFRGRKYLAWFCPDLPYNIGPWKFSGLPGLILEIEDDEKFSHFEISQIKINPINQATVHYPRIELIMSRSDFLTKRDDAQKKQDKIDASRFSQKGATLFIETNYDEMEIED